MFENFFTKTIDKGIEIKTVDITAKLSENYTSVKTDCSKFPVSFRILNAGLDEIFKTITSFLTLKELGMEDELFKDILAYPYEKLQAIESIHEQLQLKKRFLSTSKQTCPDGDEITKTKTI